MYAHASTSLPITISGEELECIENFTYLGSLISRKKGAHKDTKSLQKP